MINLKLLFIYSLLIFLISPSGAQIQNYNDTTKKDYISIGLGLFQAYPFQYAMKDESLFYFEPNIKVPIKKTNYLWITSIGYTLFKKDMIYNNLEYKLEGYYIKSGFESGLFSFMSNGIMACITNFKESGNFIFEGNYFDSYKIPFKRTKTIFYLEPYFVLNIPVLKNFSVEPRVFLNLFFKTNDKYVPTYYIPGSGYWNNFNYLNVNFDLKIFYKI